MSRPTLSLAMIVKDEEDWLAGALESVQGLVDEMVVVDTGSTDATVEIAERHGATVIFHPWHDDFSEARNVALDAVTSDWVLVLDADERLVRDDFPTVRTLIEQPLSDAYNCRIISVAEQAENLTEAQVTRLFRSDPRIRWRHRVHEQLIPSLFENQFTLTKADVRILHHGYVAAMIESRNKVDRNRLMVEKMVAEQPNEPYWPFQMAQTCMQAKEGTEAIKWAKKAMKLVAPRSDMAPLCLVVLGRAYWAAGDLRRASQIFDNGTRDYPDYTDLYYFSGQVALAAGHYATATKDFLKAISLGTPTRYLQTDTGVGTFKPWWQLYLVAMAQADYSRAHAYLILLLARQPLFRKAWTALATLTIDFRPEDVLQTLEQHLSRATIIETLSQWSDLSPAETRMFEAARKAGDAPYGKASDAASVGA